MRKRQKDISSRWVGAAMVITVLAGLFVSCEKDDEVISSVEPPIAEEPCTPIPGWSGIGFRPSVVDTASFTSGIVNPLDPNEIIFLSRRNRKLYKLNFTTGNLSVVIDDITQFGLADWSVKDWILYTGGNLLYKVKSNGDSLTLISPNGPGIHANWNPSGDLYTYVGYNQSTGVSRFVANSHDVILDTLPVTIGTRIDWFSDSLIYWSRGYYLLGDESLTYTIDSFGSGSLWAGISESHSLHFNQGLVQVDRLSGSTVLLNDDFPICKSYRDFCYSPMKGKILASSRYRALMSDGRHEYNRYDIVWLNMDGTLHEVLDIAQYMDE